MPLKPYKLRRLQATNFVKHPEFMITNLTKVKFNAIKSNNFVKREQPIRISSFLCVKRLFYCQDRIGECLRVFLRAPTGDMLKLKVLFESIFLKHFVTKCVMMIDLSRRFVRLAFCVTCVIECFCDTLNASKSILFITFPLQRLLTAKV